MGIVHELDKSGVNANGMKQGNRSCPLMLTRNSLARKLGR
jgi:hypothetical protein